MLVLVLIGSGCADTLQPEVSEVQERTAEYGLIGPCSSFDPCPPGSYDDRPTLLPNPIPPGREADAERVRAIFQIQTGLALFFNRVTRFPVSRGVVLGTVEAACLDATGFRPFCTNPFLTAIPTDPKPGGGYYYQSATLAQEMCTVEPCLDYRITISIDADLGELRDGPDANTTPDCIASRRGITCQ